MEKITWSQDAAGDLRKIFEYLELGSPTYAEKFVRTLHNRVLLLERHPHIGRVVPDWDHPDFREVIHYPYKIIYEIRDDCIIIHAIVHGRQSLDLA